jgi:endonuclease-8
MPEGDTVYRAANRLRSALAGKVLSRSDFRVPQLATVDLTGRRVLDVIPRGKHLLTRVEGGLSIHTHFRMDGSFRLFRTGDRWNGGPTWQIRLVLANTDWTAVGYRLPVVELLATDRESDVVGHLGPDVLGPDWDLGRAVANLGLSPDREIGLGLLDQRNLAGLGNLYRTEALYLQGVSPWTPAGAVGDLAALVTRARRLILLNVDRPAQTTTGASRRSEAHHVFERQGRPCRRCGATVRVADQGPQGEARRTYWCPTCQPGPGPGR